MHILGKGSEGLLDISTGNLDNWDWSSNDLVFSCSQGRVKTVSVKGIIKQDTYDWVDEKTVGNEVLYFYIKYGKKTPSIEVDSISWR